jgi:acyl carrier protein
MDAHTIQTELQNVFHDVFDDPSIVISRDTTADDIEGWDSINHVRLIVSVEQRLGISLPTSEIVDLRNVGELIDLIGKHLARRK